MSAAPEKKADDHYDGVPGGEKQTPLQRYEAFTGEVMEREREISSMLPAHIPPEKFRNTAIAAVKQNLDLLNCTRRSLIQAITRAAMDGLMPDGREGVITPYKGNAQWNPMAYGLRKRMRELDHVIADVQVVHEKDLFVWHQGDEPRIEHEPAKLGTQRGDMIGAYAIFKREDGTILHREVMDKAQIEMTRSQSKAQDSLMWTKFASEGYRKAVLRRGVKTVPVSDSMQEIIKRDDDDNFDFSRMSEPTLVPPPAPPPAPKQVTSKEPDPPPPPPVDEATERALDRQAESNARGETPPDEMGDWLTGYITAARGLTKLVELERMDDEVCKELDTAGREDLRDKWNAVYMERKAELKPKK